MHLDAVVAVIIVGAMGAALIWEAVTRRPDNRTEEERQEDWAESQL